MKVFLAFLLIILAIIVGLYIGVWVCFVGGISALIHQFNLMQHGNDINGVQVAISVVQVFLAGFAGWISAILFAIPAFKLIK